jgi:hypothetical protein
MRRFAKSPRDVGNQRRIGQFELGVEQAVEGVFEPNGAAGSVRHGPGPER